MEAELFQLKMEVTELRRKYAQLGGGADTEQLTAALLEREKMLFEKGAAHDALQSRLSESERVTMELKEQILQQQTSHKEAIAKHICAHKALDDKFEKSKQSNVELNERLIQQEASHIDVIKQKTNAYEALQARLAESEQSVKDLKERLVRQEKCHEDTIEKRITLSELLKEAMVREEASHTTERTLRDEVTALTKKLLEVNTTLSQKENDFNSSSTKLEEVKRCLQEQMENLRTLSRNELQEKKNEIMKLKYQNQELRDKVIRQDAAWKRKLDRERRTSRYAATGVSDRAILETKTASNKENNTVHSTTSSRPFPDRTKFKAPTKASEAKSGKCDTSKPALLAHIKNEVSASNIDSSSMAWA